MKTVWGRGSVFPEVLIYVLSFCALKMLLKSSRLTSFLGNVCICVLILKKKKKIKTK